MDEDTGSAICIDTCPRGQITVSGGGHHDTTIRLWGPDRRCINIIFSGQDGVNSVSLSPDGELVASAGQNGSVKLWQTRTRSLQWTRWTRGELDSPKMNVVEFTPEGDKLFTAGADGRIRVLRTEDGFNEKSLIGHTESVLALAVTPKKHDRIASGGEDSLIKVWSRSSGSYIKTLWGHIEVVQALDFCANGRRIVSGSRDRTVRIWNAHDQSTRAQAVFENSFSPVSAVVFLQCGLRVASSGAHGCIKIINLDTQQVEGALLHNVGGIRSLALGSNGRVLVACADDGSIISWSK